MASVVAAAQAIEQLHSAILIGTIVIIMLVAAAISAMVNVSRNAKCRWCEHCRREEREAEERERRERHRRHHAIGDTTAEDCTNGDCPGRK